MAKQIASASVAVQPGPIQRTVTFFEEVKSEMAKVSWPTREELKSSTTIVFIVLAIMAVVIGVFDWVFNFIIINLFRFL